jgi:hypothetical protein
MNYPTAVKFSYACKRTFRVVQANSVFAKRKFHKMETYLEKTLLDYTNIYYKINCSRKLIIYADSHDLTKVLQTHPQVFTLCHLLLVRRSKECVRLQEKVNEQVQKINLLAQKQNHSLKKLKALESTIELLRNGSLEEDKQFDELESLEKKRQKKSNKFISRGKEVNKSKELLNTNNQILEHFIKGKDVDLYLNALNTNIGTRFNLNHVGVLQQSQASGRLYFKFTLRMLEESIKSLESRKGCLSTVEENLLSIDKVAYFFAKDEPMEGLEAFKHLNQDFQNKVYFFLYLNCKTDCTPDHPPRETLRPQYGEEAFLEKNGITATPTDRLRAIMSLREFVRIKQSTKTSKAYKGNKEPLFECYHAFLDEPKKGMLLFQNLSENTKNLIYRVHWTNLALKRYVISDQMQAMLNIPKICTDLNWPKECGDRLFHDDNCTNSFERSMSIETIFNR